jgi:hypothetical protein
VASYFGLLSIGQLYLVAFLGGILTLFFDVAQLSLLPTLILRERLVEGNSKLETSRSIAMIAGPGIAGIIIQLLSAAVALIIDAFSFLVSASSCSCFARRKPRLLTPQRAHPCGAKLVKDSMPSGGNPSYGRWHSHFALSTSLPT